MKKTTNDDAEIRAFDLAGSALQGAGFKQVLILATRLDSADDAERIDVSDKRELKKYGSHVFQAMDTVTMPASIGSHIICACGKPDKLLRKKRKKWHIFL